MEISSIVEEKNPCKNNSNNDSKTEGSFIQIDSISIDLFNAKDNSTAGAEKCEHFSIREYVSKIRKKYWKTCCPFYLQADRTESEEQTSFLPPLDAPKFRWWRCQNCLSEFAAKDYGTLFNCCSTQCGSSSCCLHVGSAAVLLPGFQKTDPKPVLSETSADANASTKLNNIDNRLLFCNDEKENGVEVSQSTIIGVDIDSEQNHNQELPKFTSDATEINSSIIQERHTNYTVALKSKRNGFIEFDEPGNGSLGAADENLKSCKVKNSAEHYQTGRMQTSPDDEHIELTEAPCQTLGSGSTVDVAVPNAVSSLTTGNHSQELDHEFHYKESESVEIMVGSDLLDHHSDKSCYLHRRKSRKVRLLTELLGENGDAKSDPIETDNSPIFTRSLDAFGALDTLSVTRGQVAIQGNVKRDSSQTRKRKLPQDEEWRPSEMPHPNDLIKEVKAWKRDIEETTDAIVCNEFQDTTAGYLKTDMKRHRNKGMNDRSPILGKKKKKKTQVADAFLSISAPPQVNEQNEIQDKIENLRASNASDCVTFRFDHNAFKSRGMDSFHFPALRMERKRNMCRKISKNPKACGVQAALFPLTKGVLKNEAITRESVEDIIKTGSATNQFQSPQDSSTGKGLCLSLDSFLDVQGNDTEFISQVEDGRPSFLPWQEVNPKVDQVMRENIETNNFGHPGVTSKSPPAAFSGKRVIYEVSNKKTTFRTPSLNDTQNLLSQVEDRKCSRTHQRNCSGPSNIDKAVKTNEHSAVEEKHSEQKAGKVSEQEPLDDITMEIVELMAKNQYERCLPDAENKKGFLESTPNTRNGQMMDCICTSTYGKGELRLLQRDNTRKQKLQARNGQNGLIIKGQKLGPAKLNSVDYPSHIDGNNLNVSHLHQSQTPRAFRTFVLSQKKPSSGVQFSAIDSSRQSSGQNCNWHAGTVGHVPFQDTLLALGGYNTSQTLPQQSEAAVHLSPTLVPNQMPFGYSRPQSGVSQSNNKGMLSKCTESLQKWNINVNYDLKFLNLNATSLEKHNMICGSETFSRTNAECPFAFKDNGIEPPQCLMGQSDMYSNEAIPAMHLLSLMDAEMQLGPTFNVSGTPKLPGRPSFHHYHESKEFQRIDIGSYKTIDSMKQPSSQYYCKTHFSEKFDGCFHSIPTVGASVSSFQRDKAFQGDTDFRGHVTLKLQEKDNTRSSNSPTQTRDSRSENFVFPTSNLGTNHEPIPVHRLQKRFLGASDSSVLTLQNHGMDNSTQHRKSSSVSEICSVNRNPADFSMHGVGYTNMIRGEELKFGKVTSSQSRYNFIQLNGRKRHRNLKRAIVKERVQHCL